MRNTYNTGHGEQKGAVSNMRGNMSEQQPEGAAPTEAADAEDIGYARDAAEAGDGCSAVSRRIRVTVIDDHEMFRRGVIAAISGACDVVSEAGDVEGAVAAISRTQPDVVLLDVHVPGGEGGGGSEIILKSVPHAPRTLYLALSVSDSPADVGAVIRAGARGYVTKTITGDDLVSSIEQVAQGYAVFSPRLAGFVLTAFQGSADTDVRGLSGTGGGPSARPAGGRTGTWTAAPSWGRGADPAVGLQDGQPDEFEDISINVLTSREREVMQFIARGYTYKEVASELFISIKTVETHVSHVLRKLQLSNRGELALWAAHQRIV